jgi:hypothetical protein
VLVREAMALLGDGTAEISLRSVARAAGVSAMATRRRRSRRHRRPPTRPATRENPPRPPRRAAPPYIAFAARRPALFRLMFAGRDTACIPREAGDGAYGVGAVRGGIGGLQLGLQPAKTLLGHRAEQRRLVATRWSRRAWPTSPSRRGAQRCSA